MGSAGVLFSLQVQVRGIPAFPEVFTRVLVPHLWREQGIVGAWTAVGRGGLLRGDVGSVHIQPWQNVHK